MEQLLKSQGQPSNLQKATNSIRNGVNAIIDDMELNKIKENTLKYVNTIDNNRTYYSFILILIGSIMFHTKYNSCNEHKYSNKFLLVLGQLCLTIATIYFTVGVTPILILFISWIVLINPLRNLYKVNNKLNLPNMDNLKNIFD
jgi:hypothetical protein